MIQLHHKVKLNFYLWLSFSQEICYNQLTNKEYEVMVCWEESLLKKLPKPM